MDAKLDFDASNVYEDITQAIQHVHRSGLLHKEILSDPNKYLLKNVEPVVLFINSITSLVLNE